MIESLTRIEAAARRMGGYADEWVPRYLAEELARERDNALSDAHQSEVDSLRALHERNEARTQRDRLADYIIRQVEYNNLIQCAHQDALDFVAAVKEVVMSERPTPVSDEPVSLREAAGRPKGSISRIHQYDADACCRRFDTLERQLAEARDTIEHLRMENGLIEFYKMKEQLAERTEQRDRMVAAIEKHKTSLPFPPDYEDYQLWDSLPEKEGEPPNPEP